MPWHKADFPAPGNVRAGFSTRAGGVSLGPYDSLNLGDHVGDSAEAVATNRARFAQALGARPVFLRQVHGRDVATIGGTTADGITADACVTATRGIAGTIMVADCLPVLLTDAGGRAVAAAHAGWRGLAGIEGQGVIEAVCRTFWQSPGTQPADMLVWLGPCIGPQAFEVGPEVKETFEQHDPAAAVMFKPHGQYKWLADLAGLARQRLHALGVTRVFGNDGTREWCTVSNPSRFFSHRRDGVCGRFAASIWLV